MTNIYFELIISLFTLSLAANAGLIVYIKRIEKKKPQATYDVQALLQDLSSGPALVKIEYVDRADVLLRSPRHFS